jgi:hypothetical protein
MPNTKVTGDLIASSTITATNLADSSVTAAKLNSITTDNISEGTNLFYTDARVSTYLSSNNYITSSATANSANWDAAYSWGDHALVGYLTTETDPVFTASAASAITSTQITNWDTAYGWGNHATQSYATETYVNTSVANLVDSAPATLDTLNELAAALGDDPNFATTVSTSIGTKWTQDNTKISNWDTAYGWGNHASSGYLTSFTETDPTVPSHVKSITTTNISNWNTAYGWGNHASAGYLTSFTETDTLATVTARGNSITGNIFLGNWSGSSGAGLSVQSAGASSGPVVFKSSNYTTTFSVLPWSGGDTYISSGTYYNNGTWIHSSSDTTNCLFRLFGGGPTWYSSNDSSPSWNLATNAPLWNSEARWINNVTSPTDVRAPIFYDSNNTAYYVDPASISILADVETRGGINLRRDLGAGTGISFYSTSYHNWQIYMSPAGVAGSGANANLTAPSGLGTVTSWALRSRMEGVSTYGWLWETGGSGGGGATASTVMELGATTGTLRVTGDMIAYASDERLKTNIKPIDSPIEKVKQISGVSYDWVDNIQEEYNFHPNSMHEVGVLAQEVQKVLPEAVMTAPMNAPYTEKTGVDYDFLTVKYERIVPLLIEAIKELSNKVEELENKLNGTN